MIAVYSALFGDYDDMLPALFPGGFVLFTDQEVEPKGWMIMQIGGESSIAPKYESRYYFTQSATACPGADYTIMHGANGQLQMPPEDVVKLLPNDIDIGCFRHPHRKNVYQEAEACKRYRKDDPDLIDAQMKRYRDEGFPSTVRLSTCIFLIRRNTERLREFESFWWTEVKNGSCRDQLSFDYTRWKLNMPIHYLDTPRNSVLKVRCHSVHPA